MRDTAALNRAAAGIQQETPALEYTAEDANKMFETNVTGVFMTAQAVARQMLRFGQGGSIVLIGSMSGTVANRVRTFPRLLSSPCFLNNPKTAWLLTGSGAGPYLPSIQRLQGGSSAVGPEPGGRVGRVQHPREHHIAGIYRDCHGRGPLRAVSGAQDPMAEGEYARQALAPERVSGSSGVLDQRCKQLHDGQ